MKKKAVWPKSGPEAKGPYSPAIIHDKLVFISGQGPVDPKTGQMIKGDLLEEMKIALENVRIILEASGSGLKNALKTTVYLADMEDFSRMNALYKEYFGPVFPARTTIQAGRLPFDIKFEIDVIACLN